jgi:hypothetical protein
MIAPSARTKVGISCAAADLKNDFIVQLKVSLNSLNFKLVEERKGGVDMVADMVLVVMTEVYCADLMCRRELQQYRVDGQALIGIMTTEPKGWLKTAMDESKCVDFTDCDHSVGSAWDKVPAGAQRRARHAEAMAGLVTAMVASQGAHQKKALTRHATHASISVRHHSVAGVGAALATGS